MGVETCIPGFDSRLSIGLSFNKQLHKLRVDAMIMSFKHLEAQREWERLLNGFKMINPSNIHIETFNDCDFFASKQETKFFHIQGIYLAR